MFARRTEHGLLRLSRASVGLVRATGPDKGSCCASLLRSLSSEEGPTLVLVPGEGPRSDVMGGELLTYFPVSLPALWKGQVWQFVGSDTCPAGL